MKGTPIRILLTVLAVSLLLTTLHAHAATESRTALIIGNSDYSSGPLKNPVNDAAALAAQLEKLGFTVILKKNANMRSMEEAITDFGGRLKRGGVGLFFYAGHGLQVSGVNYLVPIGAKIDRESDIKYETMDAGKILDEMANANNGLNIVILDACRDNPYSRSFRSSARGLAIVSSAPVGTFISYSTGPGNVAKDGDGRNSPYTEALLQYMKEPGLSIEQMFKKVRTKLGKQTGGKQIPWELSSLQGDFFFVPGSSRKAAATGGDSSAATSKALNELDDEHKKLDAEQRRLETEKAALVKKKALDEKRRKVEEEKQQLAAEQEKQRRLETEQTALAKKKVEEEKRRKAEEEKAQLAAQQEKQRPVEAERKEAKKSTVLGLFRSQSPAPAPTAPKASETRQDGRFIAYSDKTVLDKKTSLMWAAKDNGNDINWSGAKKYCENYRGGGYTDWRMPTQNELAELYDKSKTQKIPCYVFGSNHITQLIRLSCASVWAAETRGSDAAIFSFDGGGLDWGKSSGGGYSRALPVRSVK